jgi:hypothetical protein
VEIRARRNNEFFEFFARFLADVITMKHVPHGGLHSIPVLLFKAVHRLDNVLEIIGTIIGKAFTLLNIGEAMIFGTTLPLTEEPGDILAVEERGTWLTGQRHWETEDTINNRRWD